MTFRKSTRKLIGPLALVVRLDGVEPTHVARLTDGTEVKFNHMIDMGAQHLPRCGGQVVIVPLNKWLGSSAIK